jgi:hypothetical protein
MRIDLGRKIETLVFGKDAFNQNEGLLPESQIVQLCHLETINLEKSQAPGNYLELLRGLETSCLQHVNRELFTRSCSYSGCWSNNPNIVVLNRE